MRTAIWSILTVLIVLSMNVVAQTEEINSDIVWDTDRSHSGTIIVSSGHSLTIENSIVNMGEGSGIVVEEGGRLEILDSELTATSPPVGIVGFGYGIGNKASSFKIPASDYDSSFKATIMPQDGGSFFGFEFMIEGGESIYGNESEMVIDFDSQASDTWITILGIPTNIVGIALLEMEFDGGNVIQIPGVDLETKNMRPSGSFGFHISSNGLVEITGSKILGGSLQFDGEASIVDSTLNRSTPVIAMSDVAEISMSDVSISWSLDDHDLRMGPSTTLSTSSVEWSGGLTDRWERRVGQQMVEFSSSGVVYSVQGLGYQQSNLGSLISDQNGMGIIGSGTERVVEIGWAIDSDQYNQSPIWVEQAIVITELYRTAWNPQSEVEDYGGRVAVDWNKSTVIAKAGSPDVISWNSPDIHILSMSHDGELSADPNKGWKGNVSIANTGNSDAIVYFVCDDAETGLRQSIGDSYVGGKIEAGGTEGFPINWTPVGEGDMAITCSILTPSQLVEEDTWGGGSITSPIISFSVQETGEDGSAIPALVAMVGAALIMGFYTFRRSKSA